MLYFMRRHILFCLLVFELNFKYFACKQLLTIAKFKPIEKSFLLTIAVVKTFMVLTPMLFHFKKARGCIFRHRSKLWYSGWREHPPRGNAAVGVLFLEVNVLYNFVFNGKHNVITLLKSDRRTRLVSLK